MALTDIDNSGYVSIEDINATLPEMPVQSFGDIDTNGDKRATCQKCCAPEATRIIARQVTGTVKDIAAIDRNGDTFADFDEMIAGFPDLSQSVFHEIDDNRVSAQALYAQAILSRAASQKRAMTHPQGQRWPTTRSIAVLLRGRGSGENLRSCSLFRELIVIIRRKQNYTVQCAYFHVFVRKGRSHFQSMRRPPGRCAQMKMQT